MSSKEEIEKYKLRSKTVEAHNNTFKRIYHYNDIPLKGFKKSSKPNVHNCVIIQPNKIIKFN